MLIIRRSIDGFSTTPLKWNAVCVGSIARAVLQALGALTRPILRLRVNIKVKGKWKYLYRAVTKSGDTIDFYLSSTRNAKAAKRFLSKALRLLKDWQKPYAINTDKAGCYSQAIRELKREGRCPVNTEHRQVKYLNNVIEADHGKLKRLIKPTLGFKPMKTAYATIKGFEVMRALKKHQASGFNLSGDIKGEIRIVERAFGLGNCVMADMMNALEIRLKAA